MHWRVRGWGWAVCVIRPASSLPCSSSHLQQLLLPLPADPTRACPSEPLAVYQCLAAGLPVGVDQLRSDARLAQLARIAG